jgi:hypothetical protein
MAVKLGKGMPVNQKIGTYIQEIIFLNYSNTKQGASVEI